MTDFLLVAPVVGPLIGAAVALLLRHHPLAQRVLGVAVLTGTTVLSVVILVRVEADGPLVTDVGGWPAPVGITLVADLFSALMLVVAALMVLAVLVYAIGQPGTDAVAPWFHPVYLVLSAGVSLSFLTGDLFNLFVAFEIMLVASYVLITLGATAPQVRAGMTYVVISLAASTLFITTVGLLYAATGTVNMADLADRLATVPEELRVALALLLLVVFGIKAAVFPLFFWLPDSYPTAPTPITAIFAGLLTKVGVYAIIRTQTLLFDLEGPMATVLLWVAGLTMLVGVLGAIAQSDIKRILSFHIVSQIGYMVFGLALATLAGLAAAIFYIVHHIIVKTSLFLVGGLVEQDSGTGQLQRIGGLVHRRGLLAVLFLVPALSLAGIPPFSGFLGKLGLVQAGFAADAGVVVAVSLVVSLLTLFSMTKIWGGTFWGTPEPPHPDDPALQMTPVDERLPVLMMGATAATVVLSLLVAGFAGGLYDLAERAASGLLDPSAYRDAVLGP